MHEKVTDLVNDESVTLLEVTYSVICHQIITYA